MITLSTNLPIDAVIDDLRQALRERHDPFSQDNPDISHPLEIPN